MQNNTKKAIVLVQMGGPLNIEEMKNFLWRMFTDKHILPYPKIFRSALATIITSTRHKKSWKKYQLIGGTPIIEHTHTIANQLQKRLGNVEVKAAFSYSMPDINHVFKLLKKKGKEEVVVIPLYPHYSITTFQSVLDDAQTAALKHDLKLQSVEPYFERSEFIDFWLELINNELKINKIDNVHLLFSGHSIPISFVKKGDVYPEQIEKSAQKIAEKLNLDYSVSYQSQIKGQKWLPPVTEEKMQELKQQDIENLMIIPISFVNENLETLYDMDTILVPYGKKQLGFNRVLRPKLPAYTEKFLDLLEKLYQEK